MIIIVKDIVNDLILSLIHHQQLLEQLQQMIQNQVQRVYCIICHCHLLYQCRGGRGTGAQQQQENHHSTTAGGGIRKNKSRIFSCGIGLGHGFHLLEKPYEFLIERTVPSLVVKSSVDVRESDMEVTSAEDASSIRLTMSFMLWYLFVVLLFCCFVVFLFFCLFVCIFLFKNNHQDYLLYLFVWRKIICLVVCWTAFYHGLL